LESPTTPCSGTAPTTAPKGSTRPPAAAAPRPIGFQTPGADEEAAAARLGSPNQALAGNRYKLLSFLDDARDAEDLLYDITIDPGERYDLASKQPDLVARMKGTLGEWKASCTAGDGGADC
jgi:hypothetical protein